MLTGFILQEPGDIAVIKPRLLTFATVSSVEVYSNKLGINGSLVYRN